MGLTRLRRPDFMTAFLGLLGLFNLIACWIGPAETAPIYGAVAAGCFGLLIVLPRSIRKALNRPPAPAPRGPRRGDWEEEISDKPGRRGDLRRFPDRKGRE